MTKRILLEKGQELSAAKNIRGKFEKKTQIEFYFDFCKEEPTLKRSQASFEKHKPFNVKTATKSDRNTCLCRNT